MSHSTGLLSTTTQRWGTLPILYEFRKSYTRQPKQHNSEFCSITVYCRPRQTWLYTIEQDLKWQNLGQWSARHRSYDYDFWSQVMETAALQQGHATWWWWWLFTGRMPFLSPSHQHQSTNI